MSKSTKSPHQSLASPRTPKALQVALRDIKVTLPGGRLLFSVPLFEIAAGERILLQGPSGCGKTTFLHLIAGLFLADQGDVLVGEHRLNSMSDDERCRLRRTQIGVVFQKLNLLDHLTVEENVALVGDRGSVRAAVDRVHLQGRYSERCSHLSLGEQQRVAVARVLAQKPSLLLADEPTSSLDEKNAEFVMSALKDSAAQSTLIVVSHDQRLRPHFDKVLQFEDIVT